MNRKLRIKILEKMAQTPPPAVQTAQPTATPAVLPPEPSVPPNLLTHLPEGYNPATVPLLTQLVLLLNKAMHLASQGKDNYQKVLNNTLDLTSTGDQLNVSSVGKMVFDTFLNKGGNFGKKVPANTIHGWADNNIIGNQRYQSLGQLNPAVTAKLGFNLKDRLLQLLNVIKGANAK